MSELRLDIYLKEKMNISRQKAQELIESENVSVNKKCVTKPSYKVGEFDLVEVKDTSEVLKYVGRGGYKLEKAIEEFRLKIDGICLDIGASTGGFTDCMLQNGAKKVYAVDVGSNQLVEKIKLDKRVISMENTDIRKADIERVDFIACDVSFISLKMILESVQRLLKDSGEAVLLIKPQFEAGKENISKKGVVKNPKVHKKVIREIIEYAKMLKLFCKGLIFSPIKGGDGNIEYLLYLSKDCRYDISQRDIESVVEKAFEVLSRWCDEKHWYYY